MDGMCVCTLLGMRLVLESEKRLLKMNQFVFC